MRKVLCLSVLLCACSSAPQTEDPTPEELRAAHRAWEADAAGVREDAYPQVEACYRDTEAERAQTRGTIEVRLRVDAEGQVEQLALTPSGDALSSVATCVEDVVSKLAFPAPPDARTLVWRFEFAPQAAEPNP